MNDRMEIWLGKSLMLTLNSSFVPRDGDLIVVKNVTYAVVGVSFTVDFADSFENRAIRCNVIVEKHK